MSTKNIKSSLKLLKIYKLHAFLVRVDLKWFRLAGLKPDLYEPWQICFRTIDGFSPERVFDGFAKEYGGNRYVKHFTCWNQLLCMVFGQLSNRDSLRDLVACLGAHGQKSYHLGLGRGVTRSTLAKANDGRDHRIFGDFAYCLIAMANTVGESSRGEGLRFRFHDDRPLPFGVLVGRVPKEQGRYKAPYAVRCGDPYPRLRTYHTGQRPRCQRHGHARL